MADAAAKIELNPVAPPQGLPRTEGFKVVSTEIGPKGEVLRLLVRDNSAGSLVKTKQLGLASFPETRTKNEYSAILAICGMDWNQEIPLSRVTATFPKVQLFPNGEILVVAPRCRKFQDGSYELNATVYDSGGAAVRQFLLGDGIEHVQVDPSGHIWVGYFDEGVYGNFGWGNETNRYGTAGLSCFNSRGERLWDFQPPSGCDFISDCYAMNVSRDGVWVYYYTGFPFVRIDRSWNARAWPSRTSGGREFAVHGHRVLHYGGYAEHQTKCKLLHLGQEAAEFVAEVKLLFPSEVELSKSVVIGRDNKLHVFSDDVWYTFSADSKELA